MHGPHCRSRCLLIHGWLTTIAASSMRRWIGRDQGPEPPSSSTEYFSANRICVACHFRLCARLDSMSTSGSDDVAAPVPENANYSLLRPRDRSSDSVHNKAFRGFEFGCVTL